jgi:hypothetical protein
MKPTIFILAFTLLTSLNSLIYSQLSSIKNFDTSIGYNPAGIYTNGKFIYGINSSGGTYTYGTFYKLSLDGSSTTIIKSFDSNAPYPCSIIGNDTIIYIATRWSSLGGGMILRYHINSQKIDTLITLSTNKFIEPKLISLTDTVIWALSSPITEKEQIFKIRTDGSGCEIVYSFNDSIIIGKAPSSFCVTDTNIFITCYGGGAFPYKVYDGTSVYSGSILRINLKGKNLKKIFDGKDTIGTNPNSLIRLNDKIYGKFDYSGNIKSGRLFRFDKDGNNFSIIASLNESGRGSLLYKNNSLFGITPFSSFEFRIKDSSINTLHTFSKNLGYDAIDNIFLNDSTILYATQQGGLFDKGAIINYHNLQNVTSKESLDNDTEALIYPNPTSSKLFISQKSGLNFNSFEIYNSSGLLIQSEKLYQTYQIINVEKNNKGLYIIKLKGRNKVVTKTIIINN